MISPAVIIYVRNTNIKIFKSRRYFSEQACESHVSNADSHWATQVLNTFTQLDGLEGWMLGQTWAHTAVKSKEVSQVLLILMSATWMAILCPSQGTAVTGCNIDLFEQATCKNQLDGPVCLNSAVNLADGPPPRFFALCDNEANVSLHTLCLWLLWFLQIRAT